MYKATCSYKKLRLLSLITSSSSFISLRDSLTRLKFNTRSNNVISYPEKSNLLVEDFQGKIFPAAEESRGTPRVAVTMIHRTSRHLDSEAAFSGKLTTL